MAVIWNDRRHSILMKNIRSITADAAACPGNETSRIDLGDPLAGVRLAKAPAPILASEAHGEARVLPSQPCFFPSENRNVITPKATNTAATVNPAVEISRRE